MWHLFKSLVSLIVYTQNPYHRQEIRKVSRCSFRFPSCCHCYPHTFNTEQVLDRGAAPAPRRLLLPLSALLRPPTQTNSQLHDGWVTCLCFFLWGWLTLRSQWELFIHSHFLTFLSSHDLLIAASSTIFHPAKDVERFLKNLKTHTHTHMCLLSSGVWR